MRVILVLGNSNENVMKKRLDRAISEYHKFTTNEDVNMNDNLTVYFMISGCGNDHEYKFMYNYLINKVNTKNIIIEDKSNSTYENLLFSTDILKKFGNIYPGYVKNLELIVCTSTFHIKRTILISKLLNIPSISWKFIHTNEDILNEQEINEMNLIIKLIDSYADRMLPEKIIYDLN
jgi:uncharacterized SAM-binding protein YcdF (DUF218 family)